MESIQRTGGKPPEQITVQDSTRMTTRIISTSRLMDRRSRAKINENDEGGKTKFALALNF